MRKCSLEKMNLVFAEIAKNAALYLPVDQNDGSAAYKKWEEGTVWSNALNTVRSPKDFFFPQTEDLMKFKVSGKNIEVEDTRSEAEDFVIFGVRGCDVKSFEIFNTLFFVVECLNDTFATDIFFEIARHFTLFFHFFFDIFFRVFNNDC